MSENVPLFPNILQPAAALKTYAPVVVKFWENQETALEDLKEFADGWFARRHEGLQAALEAAIRQTRRQRVRPVVGLSPRQPVTKC